MMQRRVFIYVALSTGMMALCPLVSSALTDAQADSIVAAEAAAEIARKVELRAKLLEVPAIQETTFREGDQTVVIRRVAPPPRIHRVENEVEKKEGSPPVATDQKKEINLTLVVTVAGDISEIRSRDPGNGNEYRVISDIVHLPTIVTVETPEGRYNFFSLVSPADTLANPVISSETTSRYTIFSASAPVTGTFESAMAVLHKHHREHEAQWKAEFESAISLRAARERYNAQNPPQPRETTVNIWRVERASGDQN